MVQDDQRSADDEPGLVRVGHRAEGGRSDGDDEEDEAANPGDQREQPQNAEESRHDASFPRESARSSTASSAALCAAYSSSLIFFCRRSVSRQKNSSSVSYPH